MYLGYSILVYNILTGFTAKGQNSLSIYLHLKARGKASGDLEVASLNLRIANFLQQDAKRLDSEAKSYCPFVSPTT